ncbi:MAG: MBL fold metallo-hydrolase, partial [Acetobacteraceae bacterium]|nr:MBL fold metallo-hydrolase [Acetobacteraceae bacterium]
MSLAFICSTCGTQFAPSDGPPPACPICQDERQYIGAAGQSWTTMGELRRSHRTVWGRHEPGLVGLGTTPDFAIGQRALLVRTGAGLVMWDCISLIDDAAIELVAALGGLHAIAISHPHYYASMVEWSRAFGDVPIWLHA